MEREDSKAKVILIIALVAVLTLSAWGIYRLLTARGQVIIWDFHPQWVALRSLLYEGKDPYSAEVLLTIQRQVYGRAALPGEDQETFPYPLSIMVIVGPLALLPLPVAETVWLLVLEVSLLTFLVVAPKAVGWRPPAWLLAMTALFTLGLYPNVWAMILGQIAIVMAAFIAIAWWGLRTGHWRLAGVCLALATIKPHLVLLLMPAVLIWAIYRQRWQLVIAFAVTLGALILLPMFWQPTWPLDWLTAANYYSNFYFFDPPLMMLTGSTWLGWLVAGLLLIWTVAAWRRTPDSDWALGMLLVVAALAAPRATLANQLVLLLPLFFVFTRLPRTYIIAIVEVGLLVGLWWIGLNLLPSTPGPQQVLWQHRLISPILPVGLTLALLFFSPTWRKDASALNLNQGWLS
jgi:hypothetical protein